MAESVQKWLGRNRPPRVQITYDVETAGASEKKKLPMVVGILSDLSGMVQNSPAELKDKRKPLSDRRFVEIDRDNFDKLLGTINGLGKHKEYGKDGKETEAEGYGPLVDLSVEDKLGGEGKLPVRFYVQNMEDFEPAAIAWKVPALRQKLEAHNLLRDLLTKLDANQRLRKVLEERFNPEKLKLIEAEVEKTATQDDTKATTDTAAPSDGNTTAQ